MTAKTPSASRSTDSQSDIASLRYFSDTTEGSTFESPKLRQWTESFLGDADRILNPCAGTARLNVDGEVVRVDINEDADADLHIDFRNLLDHVDPQSFDAIVYDPPYSYNQAVSKYGLDIEDDGFYFFDDDVMDLFDRLLKPGGMFLQFGYTTAGMPPEYGYEVAGVSLYNKLGQQNDYLGTALRKPAAPPTGLGQMAFEETVHPNEDVGEITGRDVTAGGNDGHPIKMQYQRYLADTEYETAVSDTVTNWVADSDRVLHIYESEPTIDVSVGDVTRCAYQCIDLDQSDEPVGADVVETPWNISARFATGVFDAVVLDLPYSAFQQNIRTPWKEAADGGDKTHVATAIKRAISDLVDGDGGRVIQLGRTATLMSGIDYDYQRTGVGIVQHPANDTDRIVVVDEKPHENLETVGLPNGEVDAFRTGHIITGRDTPAGTSTKYQRTDVEPASTSHFCVHCGNHYYYHPAMYVTCVDCGAHPENYCIGSDGEILTGKIHSARREAAEDRHDGSCNKKAASYLSAKDERVDAAVDAVSKNVEGEDSHLSLSEFLAREFGESPQSTDLLERVTRRLDDGSVDQSPEPECGAGSTTETALSDFA